ncbi:hypothetical protein 23F_00038 [Ralstonia phage Gerry]|uniref:Uncharacterized protein n=1 Tax=Ralstonia phage Gerry TaxID=2759727 RepID=A0A7G5BA77_9CAUD|nr:hypothetical protein KMC47_gp38 [Ralstonia phage Gerry]QMV33200.1 hypothetical protein 23F_00038 [Ralstonia phage Gerry]
MTKKTAQAAEQTTVTTISSLPPAERAVIVLESTKTETHLRELVAKSTAITTVVDANGREEAHRAGMNLKNARITITKVGKAAREDATTFCTAVIAEEKRLLGITEAEEERIFGLRDGYDAKAKAEKEERERKERERVAAIQAKIDAIVALPMQSVNDSAEDLAALISDLGEFDPTEEEFAEFRQVAVQAATTTLNRLHPMHAAAVARETQAAELAAQRAELERQQQELVRQRAELEASKVQQVAAKELPPGWKPLPEGVKPMLPINAQGNFYAPDGTLMNEDGTRSIFDDVDDDGDLFAGAGVDESGAQVTITCAPDASPEVRAFVDMGGGDETVIAAVRHCPGGIRRVELLAMPREDVAPTGYWCNGEYWGATPDGDGKAAEFIGQELKLTPFWTHGRDVTFAVTGFGDGNAITSPATLGDVADLSRSSLDA